TDHSHVRVHRHIDLLKWIARNRRATLRTAPVLKSTYLERVKVLDRYDAVASVDAGRTAMIHLRHPLGWEHRLEPVDLRDWLVSAPSLLELEAVAMAAIRGGADRVRLLSRAGTALIERRVIDGVKEYRVAQH